LVPALMKVAGKANWWAPRPLAAVYNRFGIKEAPATSVAPPQPTFAPPTVPVTRTYISVTGGRTVVRESGSVSVAADRTPQPTDLDVELVAQSNGRSHK
jgi:RND superfamily putative drug exporter